MPYPSLLHPEPLSLWQTTTDPYLHSRRSNTVLSQCLWGPGSWCAHGLLEPSEHLWREWGLILNANLPLLPSCWGFCFALGCGVSAHCQSSSAAAAPDLGRGVSPPIYLCFIDYAKAFDCVDHNKLWKILKEMGIPDHLTCVLRNLYADQKATVKTGHGPTDWFPIGKGVRQGCILSPCLFNLYAEYIMRNARLEEHKLESRFLGEISIISDMQMTPPLWQKVKKN